MNFTYITTQVEVPLQVGALMLCIQVQAHVPGSTPSHLQPLEFSYLVTK